MKRFLIILSFASAGLLSAALSAWTEHPASQPEAPVEFTAQELARILRHSPLGPLPPDDSGVGDDARAARLGQFLFFEKRLSANGQFSCASCHDPHRAFTDGKPLGEAMGKDQRHTPSLLNAARNRWFFWDGRTDSLWSQALKPIEQSAELGGNRLQAAHLIFGEPLLRQAYEKIFGSMPNLGDSLRFPLQGGPFTEGGRQAENAKWLAMKPEDQGAVNKVFVNIGKAIEAYERRLISQNAPFDTFVEGLRSGDLAKQEAISSAAQRGLRLFEGTAECRLCHSGPNFTDGEFHDIKIPPHDGGPPSDAGRFDGLVKLLADPFNAAGEFSNDRAGLAAQRLEFLANGQQNWGRFKTPSLRNVAVTPPYMHQGQFATLRDVLNYYSTMQGAVNMDHHDEIILKPRNFTEDQMADLTAFLESLTDVKLDPALLEQPKSPSADDQLH